MVYVIVFFPAIWFLTVVLGIVILVVKNSVTDTWQRFRPLAFFFCTPVPMLLALWGWYAYDTRYDDINQQTFEFKNGYAYEYKTLVDASTDPVQVVTQIRKADSLAFIIRGDSAFVRDSLWTYVRIHSNDTLRKEWYKNDSLVEVVQMRTLR